MRVLIFVILGLLLLTSVNALTATDLNSRLVSCYSFAANNSDDEWGIVDGSVGGGANWISNCGPGGENCFNFDSVDDQITLGTSTDQIFYGGNMTISFWANTTAYLPGVDNGGFVSKQDSGEWEVKLLRTGASPADNAQFAIGGGGYVVSNRKLPLSNWIHVVVTVDDLNNNITMYLNGTFANASTIAFSLPTGAFTTAIGKGSAGDFYNGRIAMVKLWNRSLSSAEVTVDYNSHNPLSCTDISETGLPPILESVNLTSEGGLGQLVNLSDPYCQSAGCFVPKTNDTTPSFLWKLNENGNCSIINNNRNLNYSDIYQGNKNTAGNSGNFGTSTLNVSNSTMIGIGLFNFTLGCTDTSGNQNRTGTLQFTINITDPRPPRVNLTAPNGTFYVSGTNSTINIQGICKSEHDD